MTRHGLWRYAASWCVVGLLLGPSTGCRRDDTETREAPARKGRDEARQKQIQSQFSSWNGSHKNLTAFIKQSLKDPDSYEHLKTKYDDRVVNLVVTATYRSKNAAGDVVTSTITAKVDINGKILEVVSKR